MLLGRCLSGLRRIALLDLGSRLLAALILLHNVSHFFTRLLCFVTESKSILDALRGVRARLRGYGAITKEVL